MEILIKLNPHEFKTVVDNGTLMDMTQSVRGEERSSIKEVARNIESKKEEVATTVEEKKEEAPKVETKVKVAAEPTEVKETKETKEEPKVTKEMVRALFTKLLKAGKGKEAKELTSKYGASKLPDLKEEDYAAVYKEAEGLL